MLLQHGIHRYRDSRPPTHRNGFNKKRPEITAVHGETRSSSQHYLLVVLVHIPVGEALPAALALVGLVFAVDHLVGAHLIQPLERFIANLTAIGPLLCGKGVQTTSDLRQVKEQRRTASPPMTPMETTETWSKPQRASTSAHRC